jgi:hypothetical protein
MRAFVPTLLALTLVASLPLTARAALVLNGGEPHHRLVTFGVGAGVAVPVSDAKDAFDNGWSSIAFVRVHVPDLPLSIGVHAIFNRFDLNTAQISATPATIFRGGHSSIFGGGAEVRIDLAHAAVQPYVTVGLGLYNLNTQADTDSGSTTHNDTNFGINGGAGISLRVSAVKFFVQGRVDNVYTRSGGFIDAKNIQVVPVTAGIEF